jgi:hypothetical protein
MARETINGISVPVPNTGEPADFISDLRRIATDLPIPIAEGAEAAVAASIERLAPITSGEMSPGTANVTSAAVGTFYTHRIPYTTNDYVLVPAAFDPSWQTYNVDVWVVNHTTSTGNIVLQWEYRAVVEGMTATTPWSTKAAVTTAAPAQHTPKKIRLASAVAVNQANDTQHRVLRLGLASASDTLDADIGIWRVEITKAS